MACKRCNGSGTVTRIADGGLRQTIAYCSSCRPQENGCPLCQTETEIAAAGQASQASEMLTSALIFRSMTPDTETGKLASRGAQGSHEREKTHCPKGHPYDEENLYVYNGFRYCRACRKAQREAR